MLKLKGFTLIELMIAVAVVGILSAIAYPSYQSYVVSSRRADAMSTLEQAAGTMERFFTINGNYNGASAGTTIPDKIPATGTALYTVTLTLTPNSNPRTGFSIRATPKSAASQKNDGMLEITHTGVKRWDRNLNGSFEASENTWAKH